MPLSTEPIARMLMLTTGAAIAAHDFMIGDGAREISHYRFQQWPLRRSCATR
jgi:hypothetical protein